MDVPNALLTVIGEQRMQIAMLQQHVAQLEAEIARLTQPAAEPGTDGWGDPTANIEHPMGPPNPDLAP